MPAVKPASAGLVPPTVIGLASADTSEIELIAVVEEPMLALPLLPMPPLTLPLTVSATAMLLPSAFLNCSVPSAAWPLTVMLASARARVTAVSPLSAVSSEAAVTPPAAPPATPAAWAAISTPPTVKE